MKQNEVYEGILNNHCLPLFVQFVQVMKDHELSRKECYRTGYDGRAMRIDGYDHPILRYASLCEFPTKRIGSSVIMRVELVQTEEEIELAFSYATKKQGDSYPDEPEQTEDAKLVITARKEMRNFVGEQRSVHSEGSTRLYANEYAIRFEIEQPVNSVAFLGEDIPVSYFSMEDLEFFRGFCMDMRRLFIDARNLVRDNRLSEVWGDTAFDAHCATYFTKSLVPTNDPSVQGLWKQNDAHAT